MAKPDPTLWKWTGTRFKYVGGTSLSGRSHVVYASNTLVCEFEMNRAGIAGVALGPALKRAVYELVAFRALPYAVSISPIGRTRDYVSSWETRETFATIAGMRRVAAKLYNSSAHAAAVEWVSKKGHGHGYHVLGKTLAHLNSTSPIGLQDAAREAKRAATPKGRPGARPPKPLLRGPDGRFIRSDSPAALKRRAAAAARKRAQEGGA